MLLFNEALMHYVWKHKLLLNKPLLTTAGEVFKIIQWGTHNHLDGPDFMNAKIEFGHVTLVGSIEMHLHTSDWQAHKHSSNPKYNNVILHVVYKQDATQPDLPTLLLSDYINPMLLQRYQLLMQSEETIPCSSQLKDLLPIHQNAWLQRLMVERLEQKSQDILAAIDHQKGHIEEVFYQTLLRYIGKNTNGATFQALAQRITVKLLTKHKASKHELESLLIGGAGLLYQLESQEHNTTFAYLQTKYELNPLQAAHWNFGKIRPSSKPIVMLLLLADLINRSQKLLAKVLEAATCKQLHVLFEVHATFKSQKYQWGADTINTLIINVIVPIVYAHGLRTNNESQSSKALQWWEQLPTEKNNCTTAWKKMNINPLNAADSQALLQLHKQYCLPKNCLQCAWGLQIVS